MFEGCPDPHLRYLYIKNDSILKSIKCVIIIRIIVIIMKALPDNKHILNVTECVQSIHECIFLYLWFL